jgi:hypothetical protein
MSQYGCLATLRSTPRMTRRFFLKGSTKQGGGTTRASWGILGFLCVGGFFVVGFEVSFQKTQGIDAYTAPFTDGSPLLGCAYRDFLEHRSD